MMPFQPRVVSIETVHHSTCRDMCSLLRRMNLQRKQISDATVNTCLLVTIHIRNHPGPGPCLLMP